MVCDIRIDKGKKKTDGKGCAYVQPFVLTGTSEQVRVVCGRKYMAAGNRRFYMADIQGTALRRECNHEETVVYL